MIQSKFSESQTKTLVTSQVLSILYYASPVWLTPALMSPEKKAIESVHYRSLRIIIKDYKQKVPREWVTASTQRLPPGSWAKFAAVSLVMKVRQNKLPTRIFDTVLENTYTITRKPGRLFGYDSSKTLQGKALTKNWIGKALGDIKTPWTGSDLNNDRIRRLLKKTF